MNLANLPDLIFYGVPAAGAAVSFLWKGLGSVPEGELGIKCRWKRALRNKNGDLDIRNPGFVFLIPFVDSLKAIHTRERTINMIDQSVTLADGFVQNVSATVLYRIVDPYKGLFVVENLHQCLENMGLMVIEKDLGRKTYADLQNQAKDGWLSADAIIKLQELADRWGVEILEFGLTDNKVIPEQAQLLTMAVGAKLKLSALRELATALGFESITDIDSGLAAAFVGYPLVVSAATNRKMTLEGLVGDTNPDDVAEGDGGLGSALDIAKGIVGKIGKRTIGV